MASLRVSDSLSVKPDETMRSEHACEISKAEKVKHLLLDTVHLYVVPVCFG